MNNTIYITVKLDIESDRILDDEEINEIISECEYNFKYSDDVKKIVGTEILGINDYEK